MPGSPSFCSRFCQLISKFLSCVIQMNSFQWCFKLRSLVSWSYKKVFCHYSWKVNQFDFKTLNSDTLANAQNVSKALNQQVFWKPMPSKLHMKSKWQMSFLWQRLSSKGNIRNPYLIDILNQILQMWLVGQRLWPKVELTKTHNNNHWIFF